MVFDPCSWNTAIDACIDEILHTGSQYAGRKEVESLSFLLNSLKMSDSRREDCVVYGIDDLYPSCNVFNISDFS